MTSPLSSLPVKVYTSRKAPVFALFAFDEMVAEIPAWRIGEKLSSLVQGSVRLEHVLQ